MKKLLFVLIGLVMAATFSFAENPVGINQRIVNLVRASYRDVTVIGANPTDDGIVDLIAAAERDEDPGRITHVVYSSVQTRPIDGLMQQQLLRTGRTALAEKILTYVEELISSRMVYYTDSVPQEIVSGVAMHYVRTSLEDVRSEGSLRFSFTARSAGSPVFFGAVQVLSAPRPRAEDINAELADRGLLRETEPPPAVTDWGGLPPERPLPNRAEFEMIDSLVKDHSETRRMVDDLHVILRGE